MEATIIGTPEQRLGLYKKALDDYKNNEQQWYSSERYAFCFYFRHKYDIRNIERLLELYAQRPEYSGLYWFSVMDRQSRIKCLEAAILLAEEKIMCDEIAFNKNKL